MTLSPREKEHLQFRFQNIYNELDLLVKNHHVDHADVERQARDFRDLHTFERIPFSEQLSELRSQLTTAAAQMGLQLKSFRITQRSKPGKKIPTHLFTDEKPFRPAVDQIVKTISFETEVEGNQTQAQAWMNTWSEEILRLAEPDPVSPLKPVSGNRFQIRGRAYTFLPAKFPSLDPRNPLELLPPRARQHLTDFSRSEPALWHLVTEIKSLYPQAKPFYKNREEFLMNDARLSFYLSKTRFKK